MWFRKQPGKNSQPDNKRQYGEQFEKQAEIWLTRQGLKTITSNYHTRSGEIDLIMKEGKVLVFIEVRYRANSGYGSGADSVNHAKQKKLRKTAEHYLQAHYGSRPPDCRFDVVSASGKPVVFDWIKNAF